MSEQKHQRRDDQRPTTKLQWDNASAHLENVMLDLETAGTAPGCAILTIGASTFGPAGLGNSFYATVSLASCTAAGLTIDPDTIAWWMKQSDEARADAFAPDGLPLVRALREFADWFAAQGAKRIWSHGASFDVPIIEAAYRVAFLPAPWKFWDVRDTRTLYDLAGVQPDRSQGTHHNALDDAKAQARAAVESLAVLAMRQVAPELATAQESEVSADVLAVPKAIMEIAVDSFQSDEYKRGHRDARHAAADLVLSRADELAALAATTTTDISAWNAPEKTWRDAPYKLDHVAEAWARGWNDCRAEVAKPQSDLMAIDCPECAGTGAAEGCEGCDECHGQGKIIVSRADMAALHTAHADSEGGHHD